MNENPERDKRGNLPGSDSVQSPKETHHSFVQNGFEHFPFSPKKALTVGFLVGIVYFIGSVLSNYKLALSEVDERIENYKPLNQRLDRIDWEIQSLKKEVDKHDATLTDMEYYFKPKGKR